MGLWWEIGECVWLLMKQVSALLSSPDFHLPQWWIMMAFYREIEETKAEQLVFRLHSNPPRVYAMKAMEHLTLKQSQSLRKTSSTCASWWWWWEEEAVEWAAWRWQTSPPLINAPCELFFSLSLIFIAANSLSNFIFFQLLNNSLLSLDFSLSLSFFLSSLLLFFFSSNLPRLSLSLFKTKHLHPKMWK